MRRKSHKRRKSILVLVLIFLSLGALLSDVSGTFNRTKLGSFVLQVFSPLVKASGFIQNMADQAGTRVFKAGKLERENKELKQEIARRIMEQAYLEKELKALQKSRILSESNEILKNNETRVIPSYIVGYSPNPWARTVLINRGARQGIRRHQTVINEAGIVGVVQEVAEDLSRVHLLIDQRSSVTIRIRETGELGVIHGTGNPEYLLLETEGLSRRLRRNDHVITAGLQNSLFPRNILIGKVQRVERDKHGRAKAMVKPNLDYNRLDLLFVIPGSEILKEKGIENEH